MMDRIQSLEAEAKQKQAEIHMLRSELQRDEQPTGKNKITPGIVAMVKDLRQRGHSCRKIAGNLKISAATVSLIDRGLYATQGLAQPR